MAENTGISWADHTINFWWGCSKVSPACEHCYAERLDARFHRDNVAPSMAASKPGAVHWGPGAPRLLRVEAATQEAMRYQRRAVKEGRRFRVFTNSMSDFFEDRRDLDAPRLAALDVIRQTPDLDWMILTKRPEKILELLVRAAVQTEPGVPEQETLRCWLNAWTSGREAPRNVWLGTTAESQEWADKRVPELLKVPGAVRFLSMEPLLGPVDLTSIKLTVSPGFFGDCLQWYHLPHGYPDAWPGLNWIIAGGESGPHARWMDPEWASSLRDQCRDAGVPFFFKQWSQFEKGHRQLPKPHRLDGELLQEFPNV